MERVEIAIDLFESSTFQDVVEFANALKGGPWNVAAQAGKYAIAEGFKGISNKAMKAKMAKTARGIVRSDTKQLVQFKKHGICQVKLKLLVKNPDYPLDVKKWTKFETNLYLIAPNASGGPLLLRWRFPWQSSIEDYETSIIINRNGNGDWNLGGRDSNEAVPDEESGNEARIVIASFEVGAIGGGMVQVWKDESKLADTTEPPYTRFKRVSVEAGSKVELKAFPLDERYVFEFWLYNGNAMPVNQNHNVIIRPGMQFIATFYRKDE